MMELFEDNNKMRRITRKIELDRELFEMNQQHIRDKLNEKSYDAQKVGQIFRTVKRKTMADKYRSAGLSIPYQLREFDL